MPISYSDIDTFMELINEKLLEVFLERHGTRTGSRRKPSIPPVNTQEVIRELSERTDDEFNHLIRYSENSKTISVSAAPQIVCYAIDGASAGDLVFSLGTLRRLKSRIISYEQDCILDRIKGDISPVRNAHSGMLAEPEADDVFPTDNSPVGREIRDGFIEGIEGMLKEFDPDALEEYFSSAEDAIKLHNDVKAGLGMFRMIEEAAFRWCIRPKTQVDDPDLQDRFGPLQYGYAKVVLSLEELKMRLSNIKRKNEGLLAHVFKDDYAESVEAQSWLLAAVLDDVGSEKMLNTMDSVESSLAGTMTGIALRGPKHLDMALKYIDMFINKIHTEVFGESKAVGEYKPVKGYIIVEEPRQRAVCNREQLLRMGFSEEQVGWFGEIGAGRSAMGILSQYTILESPPEEYKGNPPEGFRPGAGKLYIAKRTKVIDFYMDADSVPEELREGMSLKNPMSDRKFVRLLSEARIPDSFYQVSIAYLAVMQNERVLRESIKRNPDGSPSREIRKKEADLGAHDEIRRFVDENSQSYRMTLEELAERMSR